MNDLNYQYVLTLATDILESKEDAVVWLNTPKLVLNNNSPKSLLITQSGRHEVELLLHQIDQGIYT